VLVKQEDQGPGAFPSNPPRDSSGLCDSRLGQGLRRRIQGPEGSSSVTAWFMQERTSRRACCHQAGGIEARVV
jgi:hypothetical protein